LSISGFISLPYAFFGVLQCGQKLARQGRYKVTIHWSRAESREEDGVSSRSSSSTSSPALDQIHAGLRAVLIMARAPGGEREPSALFHFVLLLVLLSFGVKSLYHRGGVILPLIQYVGDDTQITSSRT
jgi:hypothetical protein